MHEAMSTNSGESGFCRYCSHSMNEHTKKALSKCKKCKARFLICQAAWHDKGSGWRLCEVPCACGRKYYPSTAKGARPLHESEFGENHPQFKAPCDADESGDQSNDYTTEFSSSYGQTADYNYDEQVPVSRDAFHQDYQSFGGDSQTQWTNTQQWEQGPVASDEAYVETTQRAEGPRDHWTLEQSQGSHQATTTTAGPSTSHRRTSSADSEDPLQWDTQRYEEETMTEAMANLDVHEHDVELPIAKISAYYTTSGKVRFDTPSGTQVDTSRDDWVKTDEGYKWKSTRYGYVFFTSKISDQKRKKKNK